MKKIWQKMLDEAYQNKKYGRRLPQRLTTAIVPAVMVSKLMFQQRNLLDGQQASIGTCYLDKIKPTSQLAQIKK